MIPTAYTYCIYLLHADANCLGLRHPLDNTSASIYAWQYALSDVTPIML